MASGTIIVQATESMCVQQYEKDISYLIYAKRSPQSDLIPIKTSILAKDERYKWAKTDLDFLQSFPDKKLTSAIHGFIYERSSNPIKNIPIIVEGEGKIYKTFSEADGYFHIPEVQPGTYKIRCMVTAPNLIVLDKAEIKGYDFRKLNIAEIEVTVTKGSCSYTQFQLWIPKEK